MADLGSQVVTAANVNQSTVRLTSRLNSNSGRESRTESEPLLPSPSHETHYVPLLNSDHHNSNSISVMIPTTTTATLRPTVTTTITDSTLTSSTNSSTKDRSALIQIEYPDKVLHKNDKQPKEANSLLRSVLAFLFFFLSAISNFTVLAIVHERVPRDQPTLPDISFDILPRANWTLSVAEYAIIFQVIGVGLLIFLHRYRTIIFRRLCIIMGILYYVRALCMVSTTLPTSNKDYYCSPQLTNATNPSVLSIIANNASSIVSRVLYMSFGMGLSLSGRHSYCGDYIYSGHTVILTLAYLVYREYFIPVRCRTYIWKLINLALFLISTVGVICVLISRGHYLIDVVIAYFATTRVFWIYHTLCNNNSLRFESSTNYLTRVWWWRIFKYFENGHVICQTGDRNDNQASPVVPRSFGWPLSLSKFSRQKRRLLQSQQA